MLGQKKPLARHECTIGAAQQRVWDLLASNVIQSMPIEQMEFLDDATLVAVLKVKAGFMTVPVRVKVEVADISPNASFATVVTASMGILRSVLRVSFALAAVAEDRTSVVCTVIEDSGSPVMRLLRWQQRRFAGQIFGAVKNRLERSCSA